MNEEWTPTCRRQQTRASEPSPAGSADYALVRRALADDSAALMQLIERLTPAIRARVLRSLSPVGRRAGQQEVDDFTQEVLLQLFADQGRALLSFQPSLGVPLEGFVRLLAHRKVVSILRTKRRSPFAHLPQDPLACDERPLERSRSLDSEVARHENLERMLKLLSSRVSPRGLDICRRLFIELESPQQVARELELSLDAVYQWRSRLAKLLREAAPSLRTGSGSSPRQLNRGA